MRISTTKKTYRNLTLFNIEKRQYLPHYLSDKGFKGTVVNQALPSLHGGSVEITLEATLTKNATGTFKGDVSEK